MRKTRRAGSREPTGRPDRRSALLRRWRARLGNDAGFTLFETLIAAVVLVVGLTTLLGLLDTSLKATAATRAREGATNLARQILEDAREIPYAQLSPSSITSELQEKNGLSDASGTAGWQVVQRGITYTVTVSDCSIDDPKDGYGVHSNGKENPFCTDSATTGTADSQPEDLKRISVDVTWTATGRKPDVHQVETLSAAGEAPGLNATGLRLVVGTYEGTEAEPVITAEPGSGLLSFEVTSPSSTKAMKWSLEGVTQSPAPTFKSGTTWTFSWSIPLATVSDGTYDVSAQAIDATGVVGPPVVLPVTLLRTPGGPAAVKGLAGGYNTVYVAGTATKAVELEWQANTERNVIGYRVYNQSKELVCPSSSTTLSTSTSCIDLNPLSTTSALTYTAYALYRNLKGELAQGAAGTFTILAGPPAGPNPPEKLVAEKQADGSVHLEWKAPTSGPAVTFYRVYRGSTNYTSRYAVVAVPSSGNPTFTDTDAVTEHEYWVTAVDANLTESSPFLGPVTK